MKFYVYTGGNFRKIWLGKEKMKKESKQGFFGPEKVEIHVPRYSKFSLSSSYFSPILPLSRYPLNIFPLYLIKYVLIMRQLWKMLITSNAVRSIHKIISLIRLI